MYSKDKEIPRVAWWQTLPRVGFGGQYYFDRSSGKVYDFPGNQVGYQDPFDKYRHPDERKSWGASISGNPHL